MTNLNIIEFPRTSLVNIPEKLRHLADAIEAGDHGEAASCVVVLNADNLEVFGFGSEMDGTVAHYLLACAQRKLEEPMLNREE